MSRNLSPVDISRIPDLVRLVDEMKRANAPRVLKQGEKPVAYLVPLQTAAKGHDAIAPFSFASLQEIKASLSEAGYPDAEVADMLEALSELPQYADQGIRQSP